MLLVKISFFSCFCTSGSSDSLSLLTMSIFLNDGWKFLNLGAGNKLFLFLFSFYSWSSIHLWNSALASNGLIVSHYYDLIWGEGVTICAPNRSSLLFENDIFAECYFHLIVLFLVEVNLFLFCAAAEYNILSTCPMVFSIYYDIFLIWVGTVNASMFKW